MSRARPLALPTIVVVCVLLAACSTAPDIPDGFNKVSGEFFTVAVPTDWDLQEPPPQPDVLRATGPRGPADDPPFTATVTPDIGAYGVGADDATDIFLSILERAEGFELESNEPIEIAGAVGIDGDVTGARILRYSALNTDTGTTNQLIDVIARGDNEPATLLRVGAPEQIWDPQLAMQIVSSYQITR